MDVVESTADVKNDARVRALDNLRNHLSYCCFGNYFSQLVHSFYTVSFMCWHICVVNDSHSKPVCNTKEAKDFLARRNIGISVHRNEEQQRVVFNFTLSCDRVTCTAVKIKDDHFTDHITHSAVYYMEDTIYVMLNFVDCPKKWSTKTNLRVVFSLKYPKSVVVLLRFGLTELDWTKACVPTGFSSLGEFALNLGCRVWCRGAR